MFWNGISIFAVKIFSRWAHFWINEMSLKMKTKQNIQGFDNTVGLQRLIRYMVYWTPVSTSVFVGPKLSTFIILNLINILLFPTVSPKDVEQEKFYYISTRAICSSIFPHFCNRDYDFKMAAVWFHDLKPSVRVVTDFRNTCIQ